MPHRFYTPVTVPPLPTDPATADEEQGSLWWRSDIDQLYASDGNPGRRLKIGPVGNVPMVRSGAWHSVPAYGAPSAITPIGNRAYAIPLYPGQKCVMTGIAAEVTLLGVGNLRAGLYTSNSSNTPQALLADFGTVSTGLAGVKQWAGLSQNLRPVLYWLVLAQQGLVSVGLRSRDTWEPIVSDSTPVLNANRNAYYVDGISGALPATFGAIAGTVQGPSAMVLLT
jgi:hypothetical protein